MGIIAKISRLKGLRPNFWVLRGKRIAKGAMAVPAPDTRFLAETKPSWAVFHDEVATRPVKKNTFGMIDSQQQKTGTKSP